MANKATERAEEILQLKAAGETVRSIAAKLELPPSSVQLVLKQRSGNGESKTDCSIDASVLQGRVDSLEILVGELQKKLDQMDPANALVYKPFGRGYVLGGFKYSTNGKTYPVVYEGVWQMLVHKLTRLVR